MWTFKDDSERLCKRAVKTALDLVQQHAELMFHEFDSSEFTAAAEFLTKCKKAFNKEMNERIEVMRQKGAE